MKNENIKERPLTKLDEHAIRIRNIEKEVKAEQIMRRTTMISASEMKQVADKFNEEQRQKQFPNLEEVLKTVAFDTEEKIKRRAAFGEYSALTSNLLYELRRALGPDMPTSVKGINELVCALSDKLKEYFSGQGFSAYAVAPLDGSVYHVRIGWGEEDEQ